MFLKVTNDILLKFIYSVEAILKTHNISIVFKQVMFDLKNIPTNPNSLERGN